MTRAINIESIAKATSKSWDEWVAILNDAGGQDLPHASIAKLAVQHGATGWWAQSIAVAYEQHIGRRQPGQVSNGAFQTATSKTLPATMNDALEKWEALMANYKDHNGVAISRKPVVTTGKSSHYWRCGLADGTRVVVGISKKDEQKSLIAIAHENIASAKAAKQWRDYWKSLLATL